MNTHTMNLQIKDDGRTGQGDGPARTEHGAGPTRRGKTDTTSKLSKNLMK